MAIRAAAQQAGVLMTNLPTPILQSSATIYRDLPEAVDHDDLEPGVIAELKPAERGCSRPDPCRAQVDCP